MKNNANVPIEFRISLDSKSEESKKESEFKRFTNMTDLKYKPTIGPNNHTGYSCFDVFPIQGVITPGKLSKFIPSFYEIFFN